MTTVLLSALLVLLSSKLIHRGVLTYWSETKALALAAQETAELNAAQEAPLLEGRSPRRFTCLCFGVIDNQCVQMLGACLLLLGEQYCQWLLRWPCFRSWASYPASSFMG